ncbi:sm-like protein LSM7 isoform X2 [Telopea speciosissima]|uniref:sm-like protein LSM7 isoform X2 n=1 Tax=Telopea speciosissima TaxID=54955 RepID=UPI001CC5FCD9|nr:sm-like protein LSM7 isoform X2 [Telopea speciosissima]
MISLPQNGGISFLLLFLLIESLLAGVGVHTAVAVFDHLQFTNFHLKDRKALRENKIMSGRKETVLDLAKFVDKGVQVKLTGGRQGTLKGYDQLLNLVLDEAIEYLRDPDDPLKTTDQHRRLGLIVCRGTAVMLVSPTDGTDEIANPFIQPDGA